MKGTDVLVIGAGVVGCLSAMALAQRGQRVRVVERGALGAESSWAGGGILYPLLPWNYSVPVNRLALEGVARYPELCKALCDATGIDPQFQASGMLLTGNFGGEGAIAWCRANGVAAQRRDDGLWLPQVCQVRNPRLLQALRAWLQGNGVQLVENVELAPLQQGGKRLASWLSQDGRRFEASLFVLTAGAWSRNLLGSHALDVSIRPMRGQMLLYRLAPGQLQHILYHEGFYLIPRQDGHILAGSTVEDVGFDKSTTPAAVSELASKAATLLPELAPAPLMKQWAGLRPGSPGNVPIIARHPQFDNLYLNTGHFRYGVTMAPASAEILASLVCNEQLPQGAADYSFPG